MFGQQQQTTQMGGFGGAFGANKSPPVTGSLFGQPSAQPGAGIFGQQANPLGAFGQPPQTQGVGGLFGQPNQPGQAFGAPTAFGQPTQQPIMGGGLAAFGQSAGQTPGFGAQQPQAQGGLFGGQSTFGKPAGAGLFGAPTTQICQPSSLGLQPQPQQTGFGAFGQQNQAFATPAQNAFGLPQQPQVQPKSQFFNSATGFGGTQVFSGNPGFIQQPVLNQTTSQSQKSLYSDANYYPQFITTIGSTFQNKVINDAAEKGGANNIADLTFVSIRSEPRFDRISSQMQRLMDMGSMKGIQIQNFEYIAACEYKQNPNNYSMNQQISLIGQPDAAKAKTHSVQGTLPFGQQPQFGQPQNAFGAQPQPFGQSQQPGQGSGGNLFNAQAPGSGGLFGQNTSPGQTGGIFGQQQPNTGGVFGQPAPFNSNPTQAPQGLFGQQPAGGGLFDQNKPTNTTFGQQTPNQQTQGGVIGGLFGQPQQQPQTAFNQPPAQTGGLFGSQPQQTGGLFGQQPQQNQPATGGLFANTANPSAGGLFAAKPASGGLFNNGIQQQQPGGLFGQQQQQQQPAGGLFAPKPATGGGLFSNPQQNTQAPGLFQSGSTQGGGLFGNKPATQPTGGFLGSQTSNPIGGGLLFGPPATQQNQQPAPQFAAQNQAFNVDLYNSKDPYGIQNSFLTKASALENVQNEIDELKKKFGMRIEKEGYESSVITQDSCNIQLIPTNYHANLDAEAERQNAAYEKKYAKISQGSFNSQRQDQYSYRIADSLYTSNQFQAPIFKPDLSTRKADTRKRNDETLKISIQFSHSPQNQYHLDFQIHSSRDVNDIRSKVAAWMRTEFAFDGSDSDLILLKEGQQVEDGSLKAAGIVADTKLNVLCKNLIEREQCQLVVEPVVEKLADPKDIPQTPKDGYKCQPEYFELTRMTKKKLQSVPEFKIYNSFGSVQFIGETDLTGVDLGDVVTIVQNSVEVYDDVRHKDSKPSVGEKLNKPAIITLNNIKCKVNQTSAQKEAILKRNLASKGDCEHLSYDADKLIWQFKVSHFTKWGDEDDDEDMEAKPAQNVRDMPSPVAAPSPIFHQISEVAEQDSVSKADSIMLEDKPSVEKNLFFERVQKHRKVFEHIVQKPVIVELPHFIKKIEPIPRQQNQSQQIMQKIQQREEEFKKCAPSKCDRPDNLETMKFLKSMGIQKLTKCSIAQRTMPRPCFHPNGLGILQVKNKTVSLIKIPNIKKVDLNDLLTKNSSLSLEAQMENLNIDCSMFDSALPNQFEDSWFRNLFDQHLPEAQLFQGQNGEVCSLKINLFLKELAKIHEGKTQDFVVICMVNALFGNPNLLLHQLHPSYSGINNLQQATEMFGHIEIEEYDAQTSKKRRNAVVELLRFACSLKYSDPAQVVEKGASDDLIYKRCYDLLSVGKIREAVKHLNSHRKIKLALLVSQSCNNMQSSELTKLISCGNHNQSLKRVINLITGQEKQLPSWDRQLLCDLLWTHCPTTRLDEIITLNQDKNKAVENLLWKMLLVYAQVQKSDEAIQTMFGQIVDQGNARDYTLRWLVQLVLRAVFYKTERKRAITGLAASKWLGRISGEVFGHISSQLVYQLLGSGEINQAYQVCMLIPNAQVRKSLLFRVLSMVNQTNFEVKGKKAQLYLKACWAIRQQAHNQISQATTNWLVIKNASQAHQLFYQNVLPLYLNQDINHFKVLVLRKKEALPKHYIDKSMIELKIQESQIFGWAWTTNLFRRTRELKRALMQQEVEQLVAFQELQNIRQNCRLDDGVTAFVKSELAEIEAILISQGGLDLAGRIEQAISLDGCKDQAKRNCNLISLAGIIALQN